MNPTACLIIIGNEILSGRTQDANIRFLATRLAARGLPLREVRVIPDIARTIVDTVVEMRARYDHVFTTGGIGPTHDDITSECIADAFGVPWEKHLEAMRILEAHYGAGNFNAARQRMATMPHGARLIPNSVSQAPGFTIGNVHVMAGVPAIMRAMFDALEPELPEGAPVVMRTVHVLGVREGTIADALSAIQDRYAEVEIGSYPFEREGEGGIALVSKGTDATLVEAANEANRGLIVALGLAPLDGEPPRPNSP